MKLLFLKNAVKKIKIFYHIGRKYLQGIYLIKDFYSEYILKYQNSKIKGNISI
jgi:hypothetical protein